MKSTIRNRAAALGIATVAGLAGIGLAGGPALADSTPGTTVSTQTKSQSDYYPTNSGDYADEFVRAWGAGDMDRVKNLASADAVDVVSEHGNDHGTSWKYTGGEGAAGTYYDDYTNTVTGEKMTLAVSNLGASDGGKLGTKHAVGNVEFDN